jgi:transcriptional regulator with XRE-family HTH domain
MSQATQDGSAPTFGALLRAHRQRALLTQEELAASSELSSRTVRRLEADELRRPRIATVRALAQPLHLTAEEQAELVAAAKARPAPRPAAAVPAQQDELPADILGFTGRSELVAEISAALLGRPRPGVGPAPTRGVAISGPPGVGKTALAVRVGHLLRPEFPAGRLYLDLRGTSGRPMSADEALCTVLRWQLGRDAGLPRSTEEQAALLRTTLAGRRSLLVLDDVAGEAQVRPLLSGGVDCGVVLTSRRRLAALDTVSRVDVGVFSPDEAVGLLTRILGAGRVELDAPAAAEIAALCGYLPLAVRIAGARLAARPHWTLARMVGQLADEHGRLNALSVGDRAVSASIESSYAALDGPHRRAFRLLGALTDTAVPDWAAAALLDPPPDAEGLLEDLVEARLVEAQAPRRSTHGRYGMHPLLRLFARERCEDEDAPSVRVAAAQRMVGGWLELAEHAGTRCRDLPRSAGAGGRSAVPGDVLRDTLADPTGWFAAEQPALESAVQVAAAVGLHRQASALAGQLDGLTRVSPARPARRWPLGPVRR